MVVGRAARRLAQSDVVLSVGEVVNVGALYGDEHGNVAWVIVQLLYVYALQQCFAHMVWDASGLTLFGATLVTVLRYWLHNQVVRSRNFLDPPRGLFDFTLSIAMAGNATLLAQSQDKGRMVYLLVSLAALDSVWAYRWFRARGRRLKAEAAYCRTRIALAVVLAGFLTALYALRPVTEAAAPLPDDVKDLISTALVVVSVVDYLLNQHVYKFSR